MIHPIKGYAIIINDEIWSVFTLDQKEAAENFKIEHNYMAAEIINVEIKPL